MSTTPGTISCKGRTISYEAGGPEDGTAPLLAFQPPGASGASIWRPIAAVFQNRYRTVAINPSGYGDTGVFAGPLPITVRDEAEALAAVLEAELNASSGGGATVVGHSYGGTIALELALNWPDLVERLILMEPAPYPMLRHAGEAALAEEISGVNQRFIETVRAGGQEAAAMEQYLDYFNNQPGFWAGLNPKAKEKMLLLTERLAVGLDAVETFPVRLSDLSGITVPTTVIYGGATDRLHERLSEIVAGAIPGAVLKSVDGAGHMMSMTHGQAVVDLIGQALP